MSAPAGSPPFEIVPVLRRDLHRVVELWRESILYHATLDRRFTLAPDATRHYYEYLSSIVGRRDHYVRVAKLGGEIVGFCVTQFQPQNPIFPQGPMGFLADLAVTRAARRKGIGQALAKDAIGWLRRQGVKVAQLTVAVANEPGQRFWRGAMGFRPYMDRLWLDI